MQEHIEDHRVLGHHDCREQAQSRGVRNSIKFQEGADGEWRWERDEDFGSGGKKMAKVIRGFAPQDKLVAVEHYSIAIIADMRDLVGAGVGIRRTR